MRLRCDTGPVEQYVHLNPNLPDETRDLLDPIVAALSTIERAQLLTLLFHTVHASQQRAHTGAPTRPSIYDGEPTATSDRKDQP